MRGWTGIQSGGEAGGKGDNYCRGGLCDRNRKEDNEDRKELDLVFNNYISLIIHLESNIIVYLSIIIIINNDYTLLYILCSTVYYIFNPTWS